MQTGHLVWESQVNFQQAPALQPPSATQQTPESGIPASQTHPPNLHAAVQSKSRPFRPFAACSASPIPPVSGPGCSKCRPAPFVSAPAGTFPGCVPSLRGMAPDIDPRSPKCPTNRMQIASSVQPSPRGIGVLWWPSSSIPYLRRCVVLRSAPPSTNCVPLPSMPHDKATAPRKLADNGPGLERKRKKVQQQRRCSAPLFDQGQKDSTYSTV